MSIGSPPNDPPTPAPEEALDPVHERERILAALRGRTLDAHQAEMICTTLALLAEMETG